MKICRAILRFKRDLEFFCQCERSASSDVVEQSDSGEVCDKTGAAVAYERQCKAGNGHQSYGHTYIHYHLDGEHRGNAGGDEFAERVGVL